MITIEEFESYIIKLGHRPACAAICVPKINTLREKGVKNFDFFTNQHNLCWLADDQWKHYNTELEDRLFTLNIRDFKLAILDII